MKPLYIHTIRNLTIFFALLLFTTYSTLSNAQDVYFEENFEDGLTGWTIIDNDTDGYNWELVSSDFNVNNGSFAMGSFSWVNTPGGGLNLVPDNYAITHLIDLSSLTIADAPVNLSWWHISPEPAWDKEKYYVYLVDSFHTFPDTVIYISDTLYEGYMDDINSYQQVKIPFPYLGSKFYLAFHHDNSQGQWHLAIDDIRLGQPIDYDVAYTGFSWDKSYYYGSIPSFLFDSMVVEVCVTNFGDKRIDTTNIQVISTTPPTDFDLSAQLITSIDPDSTRCWRGNLGIDFPFTNFEIPVTSIYTDIHNKTDQDTSNNGEAGAPLYKTLATISDYYYTTFDPDNYLDWSVFYDGGNPTSIYYNPSDLTYIGDRMTAISSDLERDAGTGELNKAILFGTRYDIKPNERTLKAYLDSVVAHVSPKNAGGFGWVEVYDYYNWTNTVGEPIEPLYISDTVFTPFSFADEKVHTMIFKFDSTVILNSGRYIIAIAEADHSETGSIGLLGARADWFDHEDNTAYLAYRNSEDSGFFQVDPDNIRFVSGKSIDYMWCMGIYVSQYIEGIHENIHLSEYVNIFPNPTNDYINIVINKPLEFKMIIVRDIAGRTVKMIDGIQNQKMVGIDMSGYEKGTYFIEATNNKGKTVSKIIKQ